METNESPDEDIETPAVPEGFSIHDAPTANWLVKKVQQSRAYRKRVEQWAAREIRRADNEERFFLGHYGQQLEMWVRHQLAGLNGRRKSINLPAGCVGYRTEPPRLLVKDEQGLLAWCASNLPAAVVVERHVLKSVVKDHVGATGEVPTGAEVVEGGERFYIK